MRSSLVNKQKVNQRSFILFLSLNGSDEIFVARFESIPYGIPEVFLNASLHGARTERLVNASPHQKLKG